MIDIFLRNYIYFTRCLNLWKLIKLRFSFKIVDYSFEILRWSSLSWKRRETKLQELQELYKNCLTNCFINYSFQWHPSLILNNSRMVVHIFVIRVPFQLQLSLWRQSPWDKRHGCPNIRPNLITEPLTNSNSRDSLERRIKSQGCSNFVQIGRR